MNQGEKTESAKKVGGARPGAGRPPEVTEERLKRLAVCRIMNLNTERTARFMGIGRTTLYMWQERAKEVQELVDGGEWGLLTEQDKLYLKFAYVYDNASVELEAGCISQLREHGKKHYQPLEWLLERLNPEQWARFEPQQIVKKRDEIEDPIVADEHKEFDPYEPERVARVILSLKEAGFIRQEVIDGLIGNGIPADETDKISSGNGKP